MVCKLPSSMADEENLVVEKSAGRCSPEKKNQVRVPKKIHKSEREKLKRDHLNELFLELGNTIEPTRQNNGKASILIDASKILRDLITQVASLTKENGALLTETQYVTAEKNDLKDETTTLEAEIEKLQNELRGRMQSNPAWSNGAEATVPSLPQIAATVPIHQPPVVGPMYAIPLPRDHQPYPEEVRTQSPTFGIPSQVRRPHARYPTPSDSWPRQILSQQPRTANGGAQQHSNSGSTGGDSGEEGASPPTELRLM